MADLSRVLEQSKATDALALLKAKEAAKQKMATDPTPADMKVMEKASAGLEKIARPAAGLTFGSQLEAVDFLAGQGLKVSSSKFSRDLRAGRVFTTPDGLFEANALLGYAKAHCKTKARAEDQAASLAMLERTKADADHKRIMAERGRLKLEQELGKLMPREEHERELAARAAYFAREVETFGRRLGPRLIQLVGGDENRLAIFHEFWDSETVIWLDAFADPELEFAAKTEAEEASPPEAAPAPLAEAELAELGDAEFSDDQEPDETP